MKTTKVIAALLVWIPFATFGDRLGIDDSTGNEDSLSKEPDTVYNQSVINTMDSALRNWKKAQVYFDTTKVDTSAGNIPEFSDSLNRSRLNMINETSPINYTFNKWVRSFIKLYKGERRQQVQQMVGISKYYFPIFETALDRNNLPLRLKYLPVIESALNPNAVSPAGAAGLWQFMYTTGKQYDLRITSYVDERRSVKSSTKAAVDYLGDLYKIYEDWLMVIAAYNCGPGNVNKAIRRSGYSDQFWKIYPFLPRETRGYVPAFIAVTHIFEHQDAYNIYPKKAKMPSVTDTVLLDEKLSFKAVAETMNLDIDKIRMLNPEYKRDVIPGGKSPESIILPIESALTFCSRRDSIIAYQDSVIDGDEGSEEKENNTDPAYKPVYYTVKKGDNLGYIAEWYDCRASDLRRWNGIRGNRIHKGDKIKIYVPSEKLGYYKQISHLSFNQKQNLDDKSRQTTTLTESVSSGDQSYYTVRAGDTLWDIAKQYEGVSINKLKRLNNIRNTRGLRPGERIKVQ